MPIDFSRRDFLKNTGLLAGGAGVFSTLPASIQKALAINPAKGSGFEDAEHIVLLMQENRSFDHCFGSLKGVRGFNDPRVLKLANGSPVWLQTDQKKTAISPSGSICSKQRSPGWAACPTPGKTRWMHVIKDNTING